MTPAPWRRFPAVAASLAMAALSAACLGSGKAPSIVAAASPAPAATPSPAPPAETPVAIPDSEVPRAAIAAETRIRALRSLAGRTRETDEIAASTASVLESVETLKGWMRSREPAQQTSRALRSLGQEWRGHQETLNAWMETTGRRLDALASAQAESRRLEGTWTATEAALAGPGASVELRQRARAVLDSLHDVEGRLRSESEKVLLLQSRISSASLDAEDALDSIAAALREERKTLLRIESPPLWKAFGPAAGGPSLLGQLTESLRESARALRQYADRAGRNLEVQLGLFVVLAAMFLRLRGRSRAWPRDDKGLVACARLVQRPVFGALLLALLGGVLLHPRAPLAFYELSSVLLVVPVVVLMSGVVQKRVRGPLYALAAIFVAERLWESTPAGTPLERTVLLGLTVVSGIALTRAIRPPSTLPEIVAGRWWRAVTIAGRVGLAALALAVVSNVVGNVSLARLLAMVVVRAAYWGVVLYAADLLLRGTLTLLVRSPSARSFRTIERHADLILRRTGLAIDAAALLSFLAIGVFASGQWTVVRSSASDLLIEPWGIGDFRFSVASALVFLAAVYASILVSRALRAVLEDDVYPRVALPRGVPETLTMLIRYSVISIGFLLAAAIAGIPLDRLAIVLGAFSVGIGFGLQTVVNNFVSGLILMFERPIQIGDTVEVGGLVGRVRSIGVRASRIEPYDGADVVVPNGTLVSNQLINWTLSSRLRRIEIAVGVAYGTDPERVLAILGDAVRGQPGVLSQPEPFALFKAFGASSLDFVLLFWTGEFENWTRVRSDMTVRVNRALAEAGIEIPFPQHDVHMKP